MLHLCVDRHVDIRGAAPSETRWPSDTHALRVGFLNGSPVLQSRILEVMQEWSRYCRIHFIRVEAPRYAEIRIHCGGGNGSWSYIGTSCLAIQNPSPTVNFGWMNDDSQEDDLRRVVLHETGHVLGLIHEHQNPAAGIPWNIEAVYAYYKKPPNSWNKETVDTNILETYDQNSTNYSAFDPESIMLYPIPKELTTGGFEVGWNLELSAMDKQFIGKVYP